MPVVHVDVPDGGQAAAAVAAALGRTDPTATAGLRGVHVVETVAEALARADDATRAADEVLAVVPLESSRTGLVAATVDGLAFDTSDCLVVAEADLVRDAETVRWIGVRTRPVARPPDPQTLLFVIPELNRPGTLLELLAAFSSRGLNLTRFATRPLDGLIGMYGFLLEVEGSPADSWMHDALADTLGASSHLKWLGTFAAGERAWSSVSGRVPDGPNLRTIEDIERVASWIGDDQ